MPLTKMGLVCQGGSGGVTSINTFTMPVKQAVDAGHHILLAVLASNGKTLTSITDTQGNTYVVDATEPESTTYTVYIVRCRLTTPLGTTDTITPLFSGNSKEHACVGLGYIGLTSPTALDQVAPGTNGTTGTSLSSGSTPTTLQSDELVFGAFGSGGGATRPSVTAVAPATIVAVDSESDGSTTGRDIYALDYETSAAGAQQVQVTTSGNDPFAFTAATYLVSAGGGGSAQVLTPGFAGAVGGGGSGGGGAGPAMLGIGLRGGNTTASLHSAHPGYPLINGLYNWFDLEASDDTFTWTQIQTNLQDAITNGYKSGIRIEMGSDGSPTWIYGANSIGPVQKVHIYTGPSDATGADNPVPWDPNLRLLAKRVLTKLHAFLQGTYSGKTYASVVPFVAVSYPMTVGTEMTIGDAGDSRNTAAWNAVLSPQSARQAAYTQAWINAVADAFAVTSGYMLTVATGSAWSDKGQIVYDVTDWAAANLTPAQLSRFAMGPTDMRVDSPNAVSYADWLAWKDAVMRYGISKGVGQWAQTAAWANWWAINTFNGGVLAAQETAYYNDAVQQYQVCLLEDHPGNLNSSPGIETFEVNTVNPAILAQTPIQRGGGGVTNATAYGASLAYSGSTAQLIQAGAAAGAHVPYQVTFAPGGVTLPVGAA